MNTAPAAVTSPAAPPRGAPRRWLGWSVIGLVAAAGVAAAFAPRQAEGDASLAFCVTTPAEAQVDAGTARDHRYAARVPDANPTVAVGAASYPIAQGEVVEFDVASPRLGQVTVHGLHELETVQPGGTVKVSFRAIYSGRFPLHFHGADGSHFEIAALEVLPTRP